MSREMTILYLYVQGSDQPPLGLTLGKKFASIDLATFDVLNSKSPHTFLGV